MIAEPIRLENRHECESPEAKVTVAEPRGVNVTVAEPIEAESDILEV